MTDVVSNIEDTRRQGSFASNSVPGLPWNYNPRCVAASVESARENVVLSQWDRVLLARGFGRTHCDNVLPTDVVNTCLNMFGSDGFAFKVDPEHVDKTHFYQSNIFCCNHIHFQVIFKRKQDWGDVFVKEVDRRRLRVFVRFMDPRHKHSKLVKLVARFSLNGHETLLCARFQQRSGIQATVCEVEVDEQRHWLRLSEHGLARLTTSYHSSSGDTFTLRYALAPTAPAHAPFVGNLELVHLEVLDANARVLRILHQPTTMLRQVQYKTVISDDMFVSPELGHGNWRIKWGRTCVYSESQEKTGRCPVSTVAGRLTLQLLSLPWSLCSVRVVWRCTFEIEGKTYREALVANLRYNDNELTMLLPLRLLPAHNGLEITLSSTVEIVHVDKHSDNDAGNHDFPAPKNLTAASLCDEKLTSFGIVDERDTGRVSNDDRRLVQNY